MHRIAGLAQALVAPVWLAVLAWTLLAVLISFFVIGPHLPDRGATPLAGARSTWFSPRHRAELETYRRSCLAAGRSLLWWRIVRVILATWPSVFASAMAITLAALVSA
jgi:hypothetical protein